MGDMAPDGRLWPPLQCRPHPCLTGDPWKCCIWRLMGLPPEELRHRKAITDTLMYVSHGGKNTEHIDTDNRLVGAWFGEREGRVKVVKDTVFEC